MTDRQTVTSRRAFIMGTVSAALKTGIAGCLGNDDEPALDDNRSGNETGTGSGENEMAEDPEEMSLKEQINQGTRQMVYLDDLPDGLETTAQQILDSLNPLRGVNALHAANQAVMDRYREIGDGTKIVEEGGSVVPYEWDLPNNDVAYTIHVGTRPHPDGPYSDMSEIIDGDTITDDAARDHLSTVHSYMMYVTTNLLGDHVPSETAGDEPPVAGCTHIVHDQENGALAWTGLNFDDFEHYVHEADRLGDTFAENFLRQLEDYAHEYMEFDEHEVIDQDQNALSSPPIYAHETGYRSRGIVND